MIPSCATKVTLLNKDTSLMNRSINKQTLPLLYGFPKHPSNLPVGANRDRRTGFGIACIALMSLNAVWEWGDLTC